MKNTVFPWLIIELFVGTLLMISLWNSSLYIPIVIAAVASVAMLTFMIIMFAKAKEPEAKRKFMLGIALSMMIPIAVFFITYFVVAIMFILAFSN